MSDPITDRATIERLIAEHGRWFHELELAHGIVTPGEDSNRLKLPILEQLGLGEDLKGARALDIGCSDGFFSFELERRGAEVVAIDFVPAGHTGFETAHRILGSGVEYQMENVYNLDPKKHGTFDVVLFLGVLYHLRKPLVALDSIRSVMNEGGSMFAATLMIDDFVLLPSGEATSLEVAAPDLVDVPLWQYFPADSLNGDYTNCFAPNRAAMRAALTEASFRVECDIKLDMGGYFHGVAVEDAVADRYRRLDGRLESEPFDPSVPYFLDQDPSKLTVTGPRRRTDGARESS